MIRTNAEKAVAFDLEVQDTLKKIQNLLVIKGREYRRDGNPYHNFEIGARKKNITPEKALDGMLLKHIISYDDILNDLDKGILPRVEVVEEKMNDILVYFTIQKAMLLERINNK
jgi:hypothetical protein